MKNILLIFLLGSLSINAQIYEYKTVTTVESLIQSGLGRSRMIAETENVDYQYATTVRREVDGKTKKDKSKAKRSEIRTKAFEETKLLNFYNVGGIRFNNIATNDAMVTAKMNALAAEGWELAFMATGVESADKEPDAIFITRYVFRRLKSSE
ncbi:MAG: hypothetical protein VX325_00840 [Bacteroidota bacterium]|nr:hypothetical protein [Bacteroidota bacterium]